MPMVMELKLSQSCSLPTTTIFKSSSFFPNHFKLLAQKWKLHIQRISWKGHNMGKRFLVHVVKKGETLSSISKLYGVPVFEIAAANAGIVDVNLVFEGQHLNIPSTILGCAQLCYIEGDKSIEDRLHKSAPSLGFHSRMWNQIVSVPSPRRLSLVSTAIHFYLVMLTNWENYMDTPFMRPQLRKTPRLNNFQNLRAGAGHYTISEGAKTTGSFLVLVPLMAFCIRCVMGSFQNRVAKNSRNRTAKKSILNHNSSNSMRWRTVLDESVDQPDSHPLSEDQEELHFEDVSHAYIKLEDDYQKFLTECGMSNWGYWRGGSPQ